MGSSSGSGSEAGSRACSASSSITCWLPTFSEGSLPLQIQRLIVSGFRPARLAASGTVSFTL
jgi:hypothetical protein